MRITHFNTFDEAGGAARAAYRLHTGLRLLGHDSKLVVLSKTSSEPSVVAFAPARDILTRGRRTIRRRYLGYATRALLSRPLGSTFFSDDRTQHTADVFRQVTPSDVLHLHWIVGLLECGPFLRRAERNTPIVWTFHDMNPFTGGCHHSGECRRFSEQCGRCPELGSARQSDLSRSIWVRKRLAFDLLRSRKFCAVAPSRWLADMAGRSSLMRDCNLRVIPYGVDVETFQPVDKTKARASLGLPPDAKVLLFVSRWLNDGFKGLPVLLQAAERMKDIPGLLLVTVGEGQLAKDLPLRSMALGSIADERRLALLYSAADVLALPSIQENFPNTALEALSCGLPVVGSRIGGIPEIVCEGRTGLLVESSDPGGLARALTTILLNPALRGRMSCECRAAATGEYSGGLQARRYESLYRELLEPVPEAPYH